MTSKTDTLGSKCARRPLLVHNGRFEMNQSSSHIVSVAARTVIRTNNTHHTAQSNRKPANIGITILFVHIVSVDPVYKHLRSGIILRSADV